MRPGALVDWKRPELPGLVGRRVFGRWHLGFGRPGHPIAVCAVDQAGAAIGWSAANFEVAPTVVNLLDPRVPTRGELVRRFRRHGWTGRIAWVPISLFAVGVGFGRTVAALARGRLPSRLAVWSLLRPRRYDVARSRVVLQAATLEEPLERIAIPA